MAVPAGRGHPDEEPLVDRILFPLLGTRARLLTTPPAAAAAAVAFHAVPLGWVGGRDFGWLPALKTQGTCVSEPGVSAC